MTVSTPGTEDDLSDLVRATDDRRRRQFLLPVAVFLAFAVPVSYLLVRWAGSAPPVAAAVGLWAAGIGCWVALRNGRLTVASSVLALALITALLVPPSLSGTAGLSPYAASIVAGILVLSTPRRLAWATAVVIVLIVVVLWLTTTPAQSPDLDWRALISGGAIFTLALSVLVMYGLRGVEQSLRRLETSMAGNAKVRRELQAARERLDAAVAEQSAELQRVIEETDADIAELSRVAMRDSLTGLFNRRHLVQRTPQMFTRFHRSGRSLALGIIDIDEFKSINDELSHATGDAVLARAADLMSAAAGDDDVLYRIGGDEFLILMPDCDAEAASRTTRRIARVLSATSWDGQTPTSRLSATWGVAVVDTSDPAALQHALAAADDTLRAAKKARGVQR